jgi:hypothetical protein
MFPWAHAPSLSNLKNRFSHNMVNATMMKNKNTVDCADFTDFLKYLSFREIRGVYVL